MAQKKHEKRGLQSIPGVGPAMEQDLLALGCREIADLRGQSPEDLYNRDCILHGGTLDRCVLYVFRCAVYYAEHDQHDPEMLKWWSWKD